MLFWEIGNHINVDILENKRADYGKQIVSKASTQLSWSHFIEILPLKTMDAKLYYLNESARGVVGIMQLREMISRKAYERKEVVDTQLTSVSPIPPGTFKD